MSAAPVWHPQSPLQRRHHLFQGPGIQPPSGNPPLAVQGSPAGQWLVSLSDLGIVEVERDP
eukprot:9402235-Prorocentrum_lima.AAC.1